MTADFTATSRPLVGVRFATVDALPFQRFPAYQLKIEWSAVRLAIDRAAADAIETYNAVVFFVVVVDSDEAETYLIRQVHKMIHAALQTSQPLRA